MNTEPKNNCGACVHWAPMLRTLRAAPDGGKTTGSRVTAQGPFIGVCGHPDNNGWCTDKVDTCKTFKPKDSEKEIQP